VGGVAKEPVAFLVCFAVKEEAKFFLHDNPGAGAIQGVVTGMGPEERRREPARGGCRSGAGVRADLRFAGGLNPALPLGNGGVRSRFRRGRGGGARRNWARCQRSFHCSKRVAITAQEKRALWESTGADAVEMESSVIRTCAASGRFPARRSG